MNTINARSGMTAALLAASIALFVSPSAVAAPTETQTASTVLGATAYTCEFSGTAVHTKEPTPVHTGPYGDAPVTSTIHAGFLVHTYYRCINKYGNIWYELTGSIDNGTPNARFIYSGYVK
ncbi:hypothetical protein G3I40_15320 [Streptomyces sp. SID14478]|uniref:hypothetical protein n=1 Tax=Streptomyces sp. SID14478 TaxID=2706073 RepID=UPI0013DAB479|nr:hypothetical protein [Streptomyces sp. SID14478]NEB76584.1 hypothetical protein [Streptomyces sp. SID14478]